MVGHSHGRHTERLGTLQEFINAIGAIEQAEFRMQVEVYEAWLPHRCPLFIGDVVSPDYST
jgi:hypothetical protein